RAPTGAAARQGNVRRGRAHRAAVLQRLHVADLEVVRQLEDLELDGQALLDRADQPGQYRREAASLGRHLVDLEVDRALADGEVAGRHDGGRDAGDGDRHLHLYPAVG